MKKMKTAVRVLLFLLLTVLLYLGLTVVLKDKRVTFDYDTTRKVEGFYAEEKDSLDFVFVGSSQMFTSVVPAVLWEEYGITSYDFGANEQTLYLSYYYIKEALKYQNPKAIVLEISYCKYDGYTHEGVHRINLDDLKMGPVKLEAIYDIVPEGERASYIFELAKYHDTWPELDEASLEYIFADKHNPYKGYTPSLEGEPDGGEFNEEILEATQMQELPELAMEYLLKIIELTEEAGVDLLFLKTPRGRASDQEYYNTVEVLAKEYGIEFLNLNTQMPGQLHNHVFHAETVTKRIGEWLSSLYEIEDKRENPAYASWHEDAQYYYRYKELLEIDAQEELSDYVRGLIGKDYLVCIAVNGDVGKLSDEEMELLHQLGVNVDLKHAREHSYVAVLENGVVHGEACAIETQAYDNRLYDHRFELVSQGNYAGMKAEIEIDGEDYAVNKAGINFVVYDPLQDLILSEKCFSPR